MRVMLSLRRSPRLGIGCKYNLPTKECGESTLKDNLATSVAVFTPNKLYLELKNKSCDILIFHNSQVIQNKIQPPLK